MQGNYFEAEEHVKTYKQFRPRPPQKLIEKIVEFTTEKIPGPLETVVDVGCGSGLSTEVFAPYFKRVIGTDASLAIIQEARARSTHSNVTYSQSTGESIQLESESATLMTVCQAIHWFDVDKFYKEAERILCKNGTLALFGYNLPIPKVEGADDNLASLVQKYYEHVLGEYVTEKSRKVYLESYMAKEFNEVPFIEGGKMMRTECFATELDGTIKDLVGYMKSWSTYQRFAKIVGTEKAKKVLENFESEFKSLAGSGYKPTDKFKITYNYFLLLGRKKA